MKVFVAGGTGVLGRQLVPQLVARGHEVVATTTDPGRLDVLRSMGADAVVMDGLDASSVGEAVATAAPDVIVHQMTAISPKPDLKHFDQWFATTNRLRTDGTDHLLAAAEAAGVEHVVAQSYAGWNGIRRGGWVKTEEDPLDMHEGTPANVGMRAIKHVEPVRKRQFPIIGNGRGHTSWVHTYDAAAATVLAVEQRAKGVFNIVDDEPAPVREWLPYLAELVGAKPPLRVPAWLARPLAGPVAVAVMTEGRGFSNARARRELGWELRYPSWRVGFKEELA